jgi:cytochrome bd-type quinol oxidase subunit 1
MTKITYILFFLLSMLTLSAQEAAATSTELVQQPQPMTETVKEPEMADLFRSEGKIYVVIAVLAIIFLCLIAYLIYIDIKLRRLENKK